jgi:hypothetical protein
MNRSFIWGVVIGVGGTWAFHRWVKPMSSTKSS